MVKHKKIIFTLLFIFALAIGVTVNINIWMVNSSRKSIYTDINEVPPRTAVMVLGSMTYGTRLSAVLQDRVKGGIWLLENGKGEKLLLSGDHGQRNYDEVNAMRLYML